MLVLSKFQRIAWEPVCREAAQLRVCVFVFVESVNYMYLGTTMKYYFAMYILFAYYCIHVCCGISYSSWSMSDYSHGGIVKVGCQITPSCMFLFSS